MPKHGKPTDGKAGDEKRGSERRVQKARRDIARASKVITSASSSLRNPPPRAWKNPAGQAWPPLAAPGEVTMHARPADTRPASRPHYRMEIEWSDEDRAYVVRVPDLPGCVTHGATYIDAARMGEEAIAAWLAGARHWGRSIPTPGAAGGR